MVGVMPDLRLDSFTQPPHVCGAKYPVNTDCISMGDNAVAAVRLFTLLN